jgi:DNA-binding transcriptional LysR family regulator
VDWDDFRLFVAVARVGSFTRAARELRVSEPTVSRRIKRLESMLDAKLFDRGKRAAQLTHEGKRALNYANAAEHSISRAVALTSEATSGIEGECKLLVGDGVGSYWMPQFLAPFLIGNRDIELVLFTTQDRATVKRPLFDLQIQYMEPLAQDTVPIRLGTLHFMLFATKDYLAEHGAPTRVEDLARHRIVDLTLDLTEKGMMASWAGISGRNALLTNSNTVLGEMVRRGGGIALMPTYAAMVDLQFVPILPNLNLHAPLYVCFERETGKKKPVRATIDYLKDYVFDRQRMPWFFDHFVVPHKDWKKTFDTCLARATAHCEK